jgi:hypothetical protein
VASDTASTSAPDPVIASGQQEEQIHGNDSDIRGFRNRPNRRADQC